jgi:hypothetical protein
MNDTTPFAINDFRSAISPATNQINEMFDQFSENLNQGRTNGNTTLHFSDQFEVPNTNRKIKLNDIVQEWERNEVLLSGTKANNHHPLEYLAQLRKAAIFFGILMALDKYHPEIMGSDPNEHRPTTPHHWRVDKTDPNTLIFQPNSDQSINSYYDGLEALLFVDQTLKHLQQDDIKRGKKPRISEKNAELYIKLADSGVLRPKTSEKNPTMPEEIGYLEFINTAADRHLYSQKQQQHQAKPGDQSAPQPGG